MIRKVREWIVDRFALLPLYDHFLDRRVPRAPWYAGDGSTLLMLLGVQALTGALLSLTYSPAADSAHESLLYISHQQAWGWFLRGLHYWSAGMMMIMLFSHLLRQILLAGYKSPREGTWLIGVLLFGCILFMSYSGYLLRWDERAVYGVKVLLHMLANVPWIGESLARIAQGGADMGPRTLTRLYGLHVVVVPLAIFALTGLHLYLIVLRGTMTKAERQRPVASAEEQKQLYKEEAHSARGGETFFPVTMFKTGVMAGTVLLIALGLTLGLGAPPLMPAGNFVETSMPAEEWWFWWYSGLIALLPPWLSGWFMVLFPLTVFAGLLALPFVDRSPKRGLRQRPFWAAAVLLIVVAVLALSDYRRRSTFTGWPDDTLPPVPVRMTLPPQAERGRVLFVRYGCNSCHAVSEHGRQVATDFARIAKPRPHDFIRDYILQPPPGIAMPAYAGRLSEEELVSLTEFCHVAQTFPRQP